MGGRGLGWIAGLLLAASGQIAPPAARAAVLGGDTTAALRACLAAVDGPSGVGGSHRATIDPAKRCPDVARRVDLARQHGLVEGIDGERLDPEALRDLLALSAGFDGSPGAAAGALDFAGLHGLLDEVLLDEDLDDGGWWRRFLQWLKTRLPEGRSADLRWLGSWFDVVHIPGWVAELLYDVSVITLVLLALFLVANEVRAAGILRTRWRRRRRGAIPAIPDADMAARPRGLDELAGLSPRQRAAAALALVVRHLSERGWISGRPSLTTGELAREVMTHRRALAAPFRELVGAVEIIVYGDRDPDPATERVLLVSARRILEDAR